MLWIELPKSVDSMQLYRDALQHNIGILPGVFFSASKGFTNFLRLSCGHPMTPELDRALMKLGQLAAAAAERELAAAPC